MYRNCIYCQADLGANETVEAFSVGRRLAFDGAKGRLWVICRRCRRWNLSPIEERWEAIEECERSWRDTRQRYSTDNIGLARLRDGLELVRVGRPRRPEFAAWRYGKQLLGRRWRRVLRTSAEAAALLPSFFIGVAVFFLSNENQKVVARVQGVDGSWVPVVHKDLKRVHIELAANEEGWSLTVPYWTEERSGLLGARGVGHAGTLELEGSEAVRAAGHILPRLNPFGGSRSRIRAAVEVIEEAGDPRRLLPQIPRLAKGTRLTLMSQELRLALEMATHEEAERRALEGELAALEAAWRQAEEIAAIADRLLIPRGIEEWIRREKRRLND